MARKIKSDKLLFLSTLLLICVSVVMVYSVSAVKKDGFLSLVKQATWVGLGAGLLSLARRVDYRHLKRPAVIWTALGITAVGLVVVLFCPAVNGARRWIQVHGLGVQPSEFAKLALIIFTAAILERRMSRINEVRYSLAPIAIVLIVVLALVLREPDFGSAVTIAAIVAVMVFAAGLSWRYVAGAALSLLPVAAVVLLSAGYRRDRLLAFLDPWKEPHGAGYQLIQSEIAVGTGGALGRGIGNSVQKLSYLPASNNDFIYSILAEELGFIGATIILACFVILVWRGLRVAARAQDPFAALLATGISAMLGVQALVNISMVLGLMPTKGIALPLVSAGGSSLLISMLAVGILLNISQRAAADA